MGMNYAGYGDFVKTVLKAVPLDISQPEMCLAAVLRRKRKNEFVLCGDLVSLCGNDEYRKTLETEMAHGETFRHPFERKSTYETIQGAWKSKNSGSLGFLVPSTGNVGAWLSSHSDVQYTANDITVHILKCGYLNDIIFDKKWIPRVSTLTDFYIIHELILTTMITIKPRKRVKGGLGVDLELSAIPANAGLTYSQGSDGSLFVTGVKVNGQTQPFPIAYRTAHVVYEPDGKFNLKKGKLIDFGVRRGEDDGLHISELVQQDEEYHIGEFFVKDDNKDEDEDDDEESDLKIVPVTLDNSLSDVEVTVG